METKTQAGKIRPTGRGTRGPATKPRRGALLYEAFLAVLALIILYTLTIPFRPWTRWANLIIWVIFVVDYLVRLFAAKDKGLFVRANILDLIAIIPVDFLQFARISQTVRFFRLIRIACALWRSGRRLKSLWRTNGLGYVLMATGTLIVTGGIAIWYLEPGIKSAGDGIWWSLVTATTVGYGDFAPVTGPGRAVASLMMLAGIGTLGMITASLATYFLGHRRTANPHVRHIQTQLDSWDTLEPAEKRQVAALLTALVDSEEPGGQATGGSPGTD